MIDVGAFNSAAVYSANKCDICDKPFKKGRDEFGDGKHLAVSLEIHRPSLVLCDGCYYDRIRKPSKRQTEDSQTVSE